MGEYPHIKSLYKHNHGQLQHNLRFDLSRPENQKVYLEYLKQKKHPEEHFTYLGFHAYSNFLEPEEMKDLQYYVKNAEMEQRPWGATQREGAEIKVEKNKYSIESLKEMPPILKNLGKRILQFM